MKKFLVSWVEHHEIEVEADSEQDAIDLATGDGAASLVRAENLEAEHIGGTCIKCSQEYVGSYCDYCQEPDSMGLAHDRMENG